MRKLSPVATRRKRRLEIAARFPMADLVTVPFEGVITALMENHRGATIELDAPVKRCKIAIVDNNTRGRIMLMQPKGSLKVGTRVEGMGAIHGKVLMASDVAGAMARTGSDA